MLGAIQIDRQMAALTARVTLTALLAWFKRKVIGASTWLPAHNSGLSLYR
jgi:hypothetical protein